MIKKDGRFLTETIVSLELKGDDKQKTIDNAHGIVGKVVSSYESAIGTGHVGSASAGIPQGFAATNQGPVGLIYGRIQSGKTRAMIASTAMAFDNGFRIAIVMTSNINDLVSQTHLDFTKDLRGVSVFTKNDELGKQTIVDDAKLDLENPEGRILVIASKGGESLGNVTSFLKKIGAQSYPTVIFDDEGDQASLDTNIYKRSASGNLTLEPSPINKFITKLRKTLPAAVYVSVTGTPQAVLLQSGSSDNRPSFIAMLPAGNGYVGGDFFFDEREPEQNPYKLISCIPDEDKTELLNLSRPIPEGLKSSILFFLLSASAAVKVQGFPDGRGKDKGYQFLCHPSLKNTEQEKAEERISTFLTAVKAVLMGKPDTLGIDAEMLKQYEELKKQLRTKTPSLADLKETIKQELLRKKILVINGKNTKRRGIEYGPGFNFLIGGNTLGRGIAVPNLLVTYYVRSAKTSQIDTMHQHARMFGYRMGTLKYTRLFITRDLYYRFRDIHDSDKGLRGFITKHVNALPGTFPVEFSAGLTPTRKGVLDVNSTESVWPGMQIYPNYIKLPQAPRARQNVIDIVAKKLSASSSNIPEMEKKGKAGVIITPAEAIAIVSQIKTKSQNTWHDKTIATVITKLSQRLGKEVRLRFRTAERTVGSDGFMSTGTLSGPEQKEGKAAGIPTLWLILVTQKGGTGEIFVSPTIVVPEALPKVFVFSKK